MTGTTGTTGTTGSRRVVQPATTGRLPAPRTVDNGSDCGDGCCPQVPAASAAHDPQWQRAARLALLLAWVSLGWMTVEGAVGLWAGGRAGSVALTGWALSSAVEGLASVIVIWRFTSDRTLSDTAERTAQKAVAASFWLLAPYLIIESARTLATGHRAGYSLLGVVLTSSSLLLMPVLGRAKHRLGIRLGSAATAGEGTQNLLCAATGGAVLLGLAGNALIGAWWLDPIIGLSHRHGCDP